MCKVTGKQNLVYTLLALFIVILIHPGISNAAFLGAEPIAIQAGSPSAPQLVYPINNQVVTEGEITFEATAFNATDGSIQTGSEWYFSSLTSGVDDYQKLISESGNTCTIEAYTSDLTRMDFEWRMRYEYMDPDGLTMMTDWSDWSQFTVVVDETEEGAGCNAGFGVLALALSAIIVLRRKN